MKSKLFIREKVPGGPQRYICGGQTSKQLPITPVPIFTPPLGALASGEGAGLSGLVLPGRTQKKWGGLISMIRLQNVTAEVAGSTALQSFGASWSKLPWWRKPLWRGRDLRAASNRQPVSSYVWPTTLWLGSDPFLAELCGDHSPAAAGCSLWKVLAELCQIPDPKKLRS